MHLVNGFFSYTLREYSTWEFLVIPSHPLGYLYGCGCALRL
uniref:Uncharacterized protein n=1 Tax=Arundo donax TaxID=35708 RepID=A0A0A8YMK1_ARUDO